MIDVAMAGDEQPDAEQATAGRSELGSSRHVQQLPQGLIAQCRAYSSTVELLRGLEGDGDVACLFAADRAFVTKMLAATGSRRVLLSGRVLREAGEGKAFDAGRVVPAGDSFAAFLEAHREAATGIVIIDRAPASKNYCGKVLRWAQSSLRGGGHIIVRNYAFWRKSQENSEMVVAINEFAIRARAQVVGFAFNGNGFPDLCLRIDAAPDPAA